MIDYWYEVVNVAKELMAEEKNTKGKHRDMKKLKQ